MARATVGAINPSASHWAGAAAGGGAASLAGQAAGNATSGRQVLNANNYSAGAAAGAMVGAGVGGYVGQAAGRYMPLVRLNNIGRPVGANTVLRVPGNTTAAAIEGAATGAGEALGNKAAPCSCGK